MLSFLCAIENLSKAAGEAWKRMRLRKCNMQTEQSSVFIVRLIDPTMIIEIEAVYNAQWDCRLYEIYALRLSLALRRTQKIIHIMIR